MQRYVISTNLFIAVMDEIGNEVGKNKRPDMKTLIFADNVLI
jgi:hypothetical protein